MSKTSTSAFGEALAEHTSKRLPELKQAERRLVTITPATYKALKKLAVCLTVQVGFHVWPMQVAALLMELDLPPRGFATKCGHPTRRHYARGMCGDCFYKNVKPAVPDPATRRRIRSYGVSAETYRKMVKQQRNVCAICSKPCSSGKKLAIDHDHKTGFVRGLLCARCNFMLERFDSNPAIFLRVGAYLERACEQQAAAASTKAEEST